MNRVRAGGGGGTVETAIYTSNVIHIPAATATAATVTAGSYISFGVYAQANIVANITGANLSAGNIQIQYSNDSGVTVSQAWTTLGALTGGASETKTYNIVSEGAPGTSFQIRLANGTGTFASTTIEVVVNLTSAA
jgi:hypothetical protein